MPKSIRFRQLPSTRPFRRFPPRSSLRRLNESRLCQRRSRIRFRPDQCPRQKQRRKHWQPRKRKRRTGKQRSNERPRLQPLPLLPSLSVVARLHRLRLHRPSTMSQSLHLHDPLHHFVHLLPSRLRKARQYCRTALTRQALDQRSNDRAVVQDSPTSNSAKALSHSVSISTSRERDAPSLPLHHRRWSTSRLATFSRLLKGCALARSTPRRRAWPACIRRCRRLRLRS